MALNGNFVPFQTIIESVFREVGYQTIDWTQAMEVVGDTIGLLGVLPAYKTITTNGLNDASIPLEVTDYRVAIPSDMVELKALRRVILAEEPVDDGTDLKISKFIPMVEATDQFFQSIREQWDEVIPAGTYDYIEYKQEETITLSGTSGTASIANAGDLTKTITFDTDLTTTAENFVTTNATVYLEKDIVLTSDEDSLIFTANTSGVKFTSPTITNSTGDLTGTVSSDFDSTPVTVLSPEYKVNYEVQYEYKLDSGYIYTNFEEGTGFIELTYVAYVTDDNGLPMIPDDPKFREAIKWAIIRWLDFKKWRVGEISREVFQYSEQQRDWYIASARSKASIPSLDKMESIKNMFLRSIPNTNAHDSYFKYINVPEMRYNLNSKFYKSGYRQLRY